ncbi:hypothetical protein DEO72_LG11g468 [Vigna unguiculata]|uniref:Pectinesterase inhibitor domain-containing protein n=1 Tax=Vigna unguiculata TaxID=3917 RepID=A0A4D6NLD6_VIGUN|nr:hypothetical protein DEO72_LG11g467 [Vigna unguiculata]QCE13475.1 hypothetical protein DEO72_LG11g468 [Vigna unguiculata]
MEHSLKFFWVLVLCTVAMAHQTIALETLETLQGKSLIQKVCTFSATRNLCIEVLSSDPYRSPNANLRDLTIISLRVAATNASGILGETNILIDDNKISPDVQQGLSNCKKTILNAETQMEDSIDALKVDSKGEIQLWLKAALAAIDTCNASIPGDEDILSVEIVAFHKLCNIAITVTNLLLNPIKL